MAREHFTLPALPWAENALEPYTSARTISFHYGKHHATYVTKLNGLLDQSELKDMTLEKVITEAHKGTMTGVFNNAAQTWNHTFFWNSMKPNGGGIPDEKSSIGQKIKEDFGSYQAFVEKFKAAAANQFGSGWAWLVLDKSGKLKVTSTGNADLPLVHGESALLTLDVWEHAYYLDYQNRRPDFTTAYVDHLINWDFANANLESALTSSKM